MTALRSGGGRVAKFRVSTSKAVGGTINEAGCCNYLVGMTLGAIHVSQATGSGWPGPLRSLPAQALRAMRHVSFAFCLLPFAFCLSGCCFSPQSKIQNRESKIMCRPFGDPDWVTETAKRLGLEWTIRPRGRPKKQSQGLPQLPVFFRFGGCHLSPRARLPTHVPHIFRK